MDTVSRKGFLQAAGAMGAMGMAGLSGMFGTPQVVFADEADDKDASQGKDGEQVDFAAREKEAAEAEGRPMDPIAYVTDKTRDELLELLRKEDEITEDYVTPSGKVIPAVYQRMRNRVNKIGYGVGTIIADSDTAWDVYMNWVSPEEAEVFCELPTFKWFTAFDAAAESGRDEDEIRNVCESMSERGLMWRYVRAGVPYYFLMCQIPGYWEVGQMWQCANSTTEEAKKFIQDCDNVYGSTQDKIANMMQPRSCLHVHPVSRDVVEGDLLPYTDWEAHIDHHEIFCVAPCQCRQKQETLNDGERACKDEHPLMTCTSFGEMAEYLIEIGVGKQLTREEARAQIQSNIDHGLVIEATHSKAGGTLCACHSDCCLFLGAVVASQGKMPCLEYYSDYTLNYYKDSCLQCGACVDRCPMKAITMGDDGYPTTSNLCVRCGQCGLVCPTKSRTLSPKKPWETFELADDLVADHAELAMIRQVQGVLVDFDGNSDGQDKSDSSKDE